MKRINLLLILLFICAPLLNGEDASSGRIVLKEGAVKKSNLNCSDDNCAKDVYVHKGDRIITGKNSRAQILLSDGTGIIIYERSDIIINNVISGKNKKPTSLYAEYGKFKIIQDNNFMDTSLVITSKNCIVKSVCSTFCFIAAEDESGLMVISGEAGIASTSSSESKAYVIKTGEESFISTDAPPSVPVKIDSTEQVSWLSRMLLSKNRKRILRSAVNKSALDWPLIKKD